MKRIVIFGATGNIGAYLVDYCKSNIDTDEYEVIAVGRRKTNYFNEHDIKYFQDTFVKTLNQDMLTYIFGPETAGITIRFLADKIEPI